MQAVDGGFRESMQATWLSLLIDYGVAQAGASVQIYLGHTAIYLVKFLAMSSYSLLVSQYLLSSNS